MHPTLTLFTRPHCEYSAYVRNVLQTLPVPFTEKDISDDRIAAELVQRGGKRQTPYLVDESKRIEMYESEDIVDYLMKNYGGNTHLVVQKPTASNVCIPKDFLS